MKKRQNLLSIARGKKQNATPITEEVLILTIANLKGKITDSAYKTALEKGGIIKKREGAESYIVFTRAVRKGVKEGRIKVL